MRTPVRCPLTCSTVGDFANPARALLVLARETLRLRRHLTAGFRAAADEDGSTGSEAALIRSTAVPARDHFPLLGVDVAGRMRADHSTAALNRAVSSRTRVINSGGSLMRIGRSNRAR